MIACVSPCDVDLSETINTLQYAAKTRSIQNKAVANIMTAPIPPPSNETPRGSRSGGVDGSSNNNIIIPSSNMNNDIIIKLSDQVSLLQVCVYVFD